MKHIALATTATLSVFAIAAPANAALFSWDVEYTGFWEADGGGSISGSFTADGEDAEDGIVGLDEIQSWNWNWSGNDAVSPFSISSSDAGAEIQTFGDGPFGFYGDETANQPEFADDLDQGIFVGGETGEFVLDLEFLGVEDNTTAFPFGGDVSIGSASAGRINVSEPTAVPEPAALLGLVALAGVGGTALKRQNQGA